MTSQTQVALFDSHLWLYTELQNKQLEASLMKLLNRQLSDIIERYDMEIDAVNIVSACLVLRGKFGSELGTAPILQHLRGTIIGKSQDYAQSHDTLQAFKQAASIAGITPAQVCEAQIAIKVNRLENLLDEQKMPKYESVADNALDLLGYLFLLYCINNDYE